jgi:hypothetical protein
MTKLKSLPTLRNEDLDGGHYEPLALYPADDQACLTITQVRKHLEHLLDRKTAYDPEGRRVKVTPRTRTLTGDCPSVCIWSTVGDTLDDLRRLEKEGHGDCVLMYDSENGEHPDMVTAVEVCPIKGRLTVHLVVDIGMVPAGYEPE